MPKGVAFVKAILDMAIPAMSVAILFVHSLKNCCKRIISDEHGNLHDIPLIYCALCYKEKERNAEEYVKRKEVSDSTSYEEKK